MGKIYADGSPISARDIPKHRKHTKSIRGLGTFEILLGLASIALGLVILIRALTSCETCRNFDKIGAGIWGGILVATTGILGAKMKPDSSSCVMISNLIFCSVSGAGMTAVFVISFQSAYGEIGLIIGYLHFAVCGISALNFVVCFIHAGFCCANMCRPRPVIAIIYENSRNGQQQILYQEVDLESMIASQEPEDLGMSYIAPYQEQTADNNGSRRLNNSGHRPRQPQEVYPTTERRFMGVINQMASKQQKSSLPQYSEGETVRRDTAYENGDHQRATKKSSRKMKKDRHNEMYRNKGSPRTIRGHHRSSSFHAEPFF